MKKRLALVSATVGTALVATLALSGCSGTSQQTAAAAAAAPAATTAAASSPASATGPVSTSQPAPGVTVGDRSTGNAFYGQIAPFQINAERSASDPVKGAAPDGKAWLRLSATVVLTGPLYPTRPNGSTLQENLYHGPTPVKSATVSVGGTTIQGELSSKANDVYHPKNAADLVMWFLVPADLDDFSVTMLVNNSGTADGASLNGFNAPKSADVDFAIPAVTMNFHSSK